MRKSGLISTDAGIVDTLGGYRLVRRLGTGIRSDVWLGSDGAVTAAIKVFHPGASRDRIDAEIEALGRASGRHLMRLEDLAMGPDGIPCLILQRLSQWSLGRILEGCRPAAGEAVTILAPLSLAVAELHRVGVAHGRIRATSVLFDDAGAPVLASFGDAELFGDMPILPTSFSAPPAIVKANAGVAADVDALASLCIATLDPQSETRRWLTTVHDRDPTSFARELADRLFRLTDPLPVCFSDGGRGELGVLGSSIPLRMAAVAEGTPHTLTEIDSEPAVWDLPPKVTMMSGLTAFMHLPEAMAASINDQVAKWAERGPLATAVGRVKNSLKPVRKPVWIMAGAVAVGVVAVVTLLPSNSHHGSRDNATPASSVEPTHGPDLDTPISSSALRGDDPLTAASALLLARETCFDERSVLCLDGVDQQGSAAMDADAAHVRLLQEGSGANGGTRLTTRDRHGGEMGAPYPSIVERLGDSVLLTVTFGEVGTPTSSFSLLLIKSNEGWRIRDLVPVVESPY